MFCTCCGKKLSADSNLKFCPYCGSSLDERDNVGYKVDGKDKTVPPKTMTISVGKTVGFLFIPFVIILFWILDKFF